MRKVILLLLVLHLTNVVFSQTSTTNEWGTKTIVNPKALESAFINFENAVFTQSDLKGIITSYIKLGKTQSDLGHLDDARVFYKRASFLAEKYYHSFPNDRGLLRQLKDDYQSVVALFSFYLASGNQNSLSGVADNIWPKPKVDSIQTIPYLLEAAQQLGDHFDLLTVNTQGINLEIASINTSSTNIELSEQKLTTAFFLAVTEPVNNNEEEVVFTLTKKTSLRQAATHKSRSLKRITDGTELTVIEKTDHFWWKVEVGGRTGYVKALLLE